MPVMGLNVSSPFICLATDEKSGKISFIDLVEQGRQNFKNPLNRINVIVSKIKCVVK